MRVLSLVLALISLPTLAAGQSQGTYTTFGSGCAGTGGPGCPSNNSGGGRLLGRHNANTFAIEAVAGSTLVIRGFQLFFQASGSSPLKIKGHLYLADAQNRLPLSAPKASADLTVGTSPGWYRTTFSSPVIVAAKRKFFLSYDPSSSLWYPFVAGGKNSPAYWHSPSSKVWKPTVAPWAFKVDCAGGGAVPALGNTGVPKINASFAVNLSRARSNTGAGLILGSSRTRWGAVPLPLDLGPAGARGCFLRASLDLLLPVVTDGGGSASAKLAVPNQRALIGQTFHNQFLVVDPGANGLGLAWSNGGSGKVGG